MFISSLVSLAYKLALSLLPVSSSLFFLFSSSKGFLKLRLRSSNIKLIEDLLTSALTHICPSTTQFMSSRKLQEPISAQSQREIRERVSLEFLSFTANRRRAKKPSSALSKVSMVTRTPDQVNRGMLTIFNSASNTAPKLTEMSSVVTSTCFSPDPQMTSTRYRLTDGQIGYALTKVYDTEKTDALTETMVSSTATPNSSTKFGSYCLTSTQLAYATTDINTPSTSEVNLVAKSDDLTKSLVSSPTAPEHSSKSSLYRLTSPHLNHATTDVNVPATTDVSSDTRVPFCDPIFGSALVFPTSLTRYQFTRKHLDQTVAVDTRNQTPIEAKDSAVNESSSDTCLGCLAEPGTGSIFDSSPRNSTRDSITGDLASDNDNVVGVDHSTTSIGTPPKSTRRFQNERSSSSLASSILIGTSLDNRRTTTHDHVAAQSSDNESSTGCERSDSGALPQDGADSQSQTPEVHAPQPDKPISADMTRLIQDIEFTPLPSPMVSSTL